MAIATVSIIVPASGDGPVASIANLVGEKTVVLTGTFAGTYTLLGSHDGATFVPVLSFNSDGIEGIKQTLPESIDSVRVRTSANTTGAVTMTVTGVSAPGENRFAALVIFPAGNGGTSAVIDTYALFPGTTGLEEDINFICRGSFTDKVIVEGSTDSVTWNPIGFFQGGTLPRTLLGQQLVYEFNPLETPDKIRYLRVTASNQILLATTVTVGGRIPIPPPVPTARTLIELCENDGEVYACPSGPFVDEGILFEWQINLSMLVPGQPISIIELMGIARSNIADANPATFNLYLGSVTPGSTAGGTLRASVATTSVAEVMVSGIGVTFTNPGGKCLAQITGKIVDNLHQAYMRGVYVNLG